MANEWNKTTLAVGEFEPMLRRHLRSGAAPIVACSGFDPDAASAYIEGALGGSQRTRYESHLAGCATCRRHLIEIARLAQTVPIAEALPVTVTGQTPAWERWRQVVAGWFDFSAWNLKWQIAGATGAAFAILIAVLGALSWRQTSSRTDDAIATSAASLSSAISGVQPLQSPNPEPSPLDAGAAPFEDLAANYRGLPHVPAPALPKGPIGEAQLSVLPASDKPITLDESQSVEAPAAARPVGGQAGQNPAPQPRAAAELRSLSNPDGHDLFRRDQAALDAGQGARFAPPDVYNPMNPGQSDPNNQTTVGDSRMAGRYLQPPKSSPRIPINPSEPLKLYGIAKDLITRIKSRPKSDSRRKDNAEAFEDESPKPMLIPIRNKVFRFEKGTLIDREYNPDLQEWRVWTLKPGSDLYKKVLTDEPLLKEFFDRGPIIIVWKNRIYKVLK